MSSKIFCLLGLALAASMPSFASTFFGTSIPVPAGLVLGDEFQLVFVTSNTTAATNTSISYYNTFVNTDAGQAGSLLDVSAMSGITWSVLGSTEAVNVLSNIINSTSSPTFAGIFDLAGNEIAADTSGNTGGLYSGAIKHTLEVDEAGVSLFTYVWTGTFTDGTSDVSAPLGSGFGVGIAGLTPVKSGSWTEDATDDTTTTNSLYGISPILELGPSNTIEVATPEPDTLGMALIGLVCC